MKNVWIWQQMLTPHMAYLAEELASRGHQVTYVATRLISEERKRQGWKAPSLRTVKILLISEKEEIAGLIQSIPMDSIQLCEGLRGNGLIGYIQKLLVRSGLKYWVVMESIDDNGMAGMAKRLLYRLVLESRKGSVTGILAIGWRTSKWLIELGSHPAYVFPFAYFLDEAGPRGVKAKKTGSIFRFIYVGQLIERKRLDLLIEALACQDQDFELVVIGDGPMRSQWQALAESRIPNSVHWLGKLPMDKVPQWMADADCLVLPSRFDGWGAVVSEALMVGTPVICSNACGSAEVVRNSGFGGVFRSGDGDALSSLLTAMLKKGSLHIRKRQQLGRWAECLSASAGAEYLQSILKYANTETPSAKPLPPWCMKALHQVPST